MVGVTPGKRSGAGRLEMTAAVVVAGAVARAAGVTVGTGVAAGGGRDRTPVTGPPGETGRRTGVAWGGIIGVW